MIEYDPPAKVRMRTAYLYWVLFGAIGGHRFYLGLRSGKYMLTLFLTAFLLVVIQLNSQTNLLSGLFVGILFSWWILDGYQLYYFVKKKNRRIDEIKLHKSFNNCIQP